MGEAKGSGGGEEREEKGANAHGIIAQDLDLQRPWPAERYW